jgi:hypothetical protein
MSYFYPAGKAVLAYFEHGHQIKSQESQVVEIVGSQALAQQVGMNEPKTPQTAGTPP